MALQLELETGDQFGKRCAPRLLEPVLERCQTRTKLLGVGAAFYHPVVRIASAPRPVEVEAKEGEPPAAFQLPPVEFHQRALLLGEFESEFRQSFRQFPQIGLSIVLSLETNDAVIRIAPEEDASLAFPRHPLLDSQVLDEMKIDIS